MSIIVNGAPKSATLFVSELLRHNLSREDYRVATRGALQSIIMPNEYFNFVGSNHFVAQQHISPVEFNFLFLKEFPPSLFIHLVRDPKDVIISWKHHITRATLNPWESVMYIAEGSISPDFYQFSDDEQFDFLVEKYFPKLCHWMDEWIRSYKSLGNQFYLLKSSPEVLNSQSTWVTLLEESNVSCNRFELLDYTTSKHFRSGKNSQYLDYMDKQQIQKLKTEQDKHEYLSQFFC